MLIACSLTGVDAWTDLDELSELASQHPVAEFAVLYSHTRAGRDPRYPERKVIEALAERGSAKGFKAAVHLCGSAVADFVAGKKDVTDIVDLFGRVQLNFSALMASFSLDELNMAIERFQGNVITQHNEMNREVAKAVTATNHHVLFDASLGMGIRVKEWPAPLPGKTCGFAGGIGPDNVREVIASLDGTIKNHDCWIDMESRLRNPADRFDLGSCRKVLESLKVS